MTKMLSYLNDPAVKAKYAARFAAHRLADELIQGIGFEKDQRGRCRGCFVGCTLNEYSHDQFQIELGWPEWLARLADTIFEGIPSQEAPQFGTDLLEAVPVGVDLDPVRARFLLTIQHRNLIRMESNTARTSQDAIAVIKTVIELMEKDNATAVDHGSASNVVRSNAWIARSCAADSVAKAPWSAENAAAWSAADSAAWASADFDVRSAAWSAARSAAVAAADAIAEADAEAFGYAEYKIMRDDLLSICRKLTVA